VASASSNFAGYRSEPYSAPELATSVAQAREVTNAAGAAIALGDAKSNEVLCCARNGNLAPELGVASLAEESLTALCLRSGKQLRSDDTATDPRVCSSAASALAVRSIVATPIQQEAKVVGVLAVFSDSPGAFSSQHLTGLKAIADQIARILREPHSPTPGKPKRPQSARLTFPDEGAKQKASEQDVVLDMPRLEAEKPLLLSTPHSFATFDAVADRRRVSPSANLIMVVGFALLVITASAAWAYLQRARPLNVETETNIQAVQESSTTPATVHPQFEAPASTAGTEAPVRDVVAEKANPAPTVVSHKSAPSAMPLRPNGSTRPAERPALVASASNDPAGKDSPASGAAKEAATRPVTSNNVSVPPAPASTPAIQLASAALPPVAVPDVHATPKLESEFKSTIVPARLVRSVKPPYPTFARQMKLSATLMVQAKISKDGKLTDIQFVSGSSLFQQTALDALKLWRYTPATLDGKVIEQDIQIRLDFKPSNQ
jgi:TonB family protein